MKKVYFLTLAILFGFGMSANAQAPFANGGFETWTNGVPDSWTIDPDSTNLTGGTATNPAVTQMTTGATEGTSYMKLTTTTVSGSTYAPIPDGVYPVSAMQICAPGAQPYNQVTLDVNYDVKPGDKAAVAVIGFYNNGGTPAVATGGFQTFTGTQAALTSVTIPINEIVAGKTIIAYSVTISTNDAKAGLTGTTSTPTDGTWIGADNVQLKHVAPAPNVTNLVAADIADAGNGSDLQVTFDVPADESQIEGYYLTVTDQNVSQALFTGNYSIFEPTAKKITPNGNNVSYTFTAADTYWKFTPPSSIAPTPIAENVPMYVYVYVKAKSGSISVVAQSNGITLTNSTAGITENAKGDITVYPNPARNFVNISANGIANGFVHIYSTTGKVVAQKAIANGTSKVNVNNLDNGVYIYTIQNSQGEILKTSKLVIAK